jgi:hypothetical protein
MPRWMPLLILSALIVGVLSWLLATKQGAQARRQLTKQGQMVLEQGERTLDQVGRKVQGSTQELLTQGRRLVDIVTK